MPKVISGNVQAVLGQLRRADPDARVDVELALKRTGVQGLTTRLTFIETCRERGTWRRMRQAGPEGTIASLSGRPKDLIEPLTSLGEKERELA
jgi:hypothetical protein